MLAKSGKSGIDPIEAKSASPRKVPTFTRRAAAYIPAHRHGWKNANHGRQSVRTQKTYARPALGDLSVDRIDTTDVLKVLQPTWTNKTETAKRVQGRMESILEYAAAHKFEKRRKMMQ